ncbi:MAG: pyridoxal-phosphate dependent enzyme [Gammaproteobacteria bacterium PRO9]|nr:pyridoxal-phosphate dependent enzyme [Gammaproteobacteria bacterium PRO9]
MNRLSLSAWPTALQPAPRLGAAIGAPDLLVKRDDLSGTIYGGNKVRKLEYLLADALARGCDAVLTYGATGSNHALATAICARQAGLKCYCVLVDQVQTPWVANTLRWHALTGTTLAPAADFGGVKAAAEALRNGHPGGSDRVCEIPWGGSSPLGSQGFVAAADELLAELATIAPGRPIRVYLPCGTMGSAAGLLAGFARARADATVVSVKVVPQHVDAAAVGQATTAILALLPDGEVAAREIASRLEFRSEFAGTEYAVPTAGGIEALALARELQDLELDTNYSGKALACLIDDARQHRLAGALPVFWHTWNSRPYPEELSEVDTSRLPAAFGKYFG